MLWRRKPSRRWMEHLSYNEFWVFGFCSQTFLVHVLTSLCSTVELERACKVESRNELLNSTTQTQLARNQCEKHNKQLCFEGFGMLESGIVSLKNEVNIMMKNVVDVVLGGVTYWAFGYGLSYGSGEASNNKCLVLCDSYLVILQQ